MAASYNILFKDRLLINVINGETPVMGSYGLHVGHDDRYALSSEYWSVFSRLMAGETVTFEGSHIHVRNAAVNAGLKEGLGHVPLWFSGSSEPAIELAGRQFDKYLSWGEPPARLAEKLDRVRERAAEYGRTVDFGLRVPLIVAETDDEAWRHANRLIELTRPETIKARLANLQKGGSYGGGSVGIQRQAAFINGIPQRARDLEIYPNLWAGMTLLNAGAPAALVGSAENVAERLAEYEAIGIDTFILSSHPLLEGARYVAEAVLPRLRSSAATSDQRMRQAEPA